MSSDQTTALDYAILAAGMTTEITTDPTGGGVTSALGYPPFQSGGVDVSGVSRADVLVGLGEDGLHRRAWISFTTVDLATTYQLQIGAGNVTYNAGAGAPADTAALIAQWAAALNANATMAAIVTAEADPDDDEVLRLTWVWTPTGIDLTVGGATADVQVETEYVEGIAVVFARGVSRVVLSTDEDSTDARTRASGWAALFVDGVQALYNMENSAGLRVKVPCAGVSALAVVVYDLDGHASDAVSGGAASNLAYRAPWCAIAPCVQS